jgi:hypothetical protein
MVKNITAIARMDKRYEMARARVFTHPPYQNRIKEILKTPEG